MATTPAPPVVIEGRVGRKVNNALFIDFSEGGDKPFARAQQGAGGGFGGKLAILFGFMNGGTGKHLLTYTDGATLIVETRDSKPSLVSRNGTPIASITRADTTTATATDGSVIYKFAGDPEAEGVSELWRALITLPDGTPAGRLDVINSNSGWEIGVEDVLDLIGGDFGGGGSSSLPIPFLGTRLILTEPTSELQRDVLLAACIDIALGVRPYFTAMGGPPPAA
jgi:hypothetical protein